MNGTRWAIMPLMNATSRDRKPCVAPPKQDRFHQGHLIPAEGYRTQNRTV
jgi:hypothetical protein